MKPVVEVHHDPNDSDYEAEETEETEETETDTESIASSDVSDASDTSVITDVSEDDDEDTNILIKLKEVEIELKYERLNTIEKLKLYDFKLQFYMQYKYMYYLSLLMNIALIVTHIVSLPDLLQESTSYLL